MKFRMLEQMLVVVLFALSGTVAVSASPGVSNVRAEQREGAKLMDVSYDLSAGKTALTVMLLVSTNNGGKYDVLATSVSGSGAGSVVTPGVDRKMVWDVSADWNDQHSTQVWVKVKAKNETTTEKVNSLCYIPSGYFLMGDNYNLGNIESDSEQPVHNVYVNPFYISKYTLTNEEARNILQWAYDHEKILVYATPSGRSISVLPIDAHPGPILVAYDIFLNLYSEAYPFSDIFFSDGRFSVLNNREKYPCVNITWYGAQALCVYKSEMEGLYPCVNLSARDWSCDFTKNGYRLPTEAEWEKSARGGLDGHHFPWPSYGGNWSDHLDESMANFPVSSLIYNPASTPVGYYDGNQYPPGDDMANGYGLYDMAGNVLEWCYDWYSSSYYSVSPSVNPMGPSSGGHRVTRGGSWRPSYDELFLRALRCSARSSYYPEIGALNIGFRYVRNAPETPQSSTSQIKAGSSSIHGPITIDTTGPDTPGILQFNTTSATADANAGSVTLSVMRLGGTLGTATVDYATSDDTALAGTDYSSATGTLHWADGDSTQQTVSVTLLPSSGGDKTFSVLLSNTTGATPSEGYTNAVVTIKSAESRNPVYRLYSYGQPDSTYEHVWTTDWNEMAIMSTAYGWLYEGVAWRAFSEYVQGTVPLYRLYAPSTRMHHYTIDGNEYYILTQHSGGAWNGEGIQYFVYPDDSVPGTMPVYRFYHAGMGLHHFTIDAGEAAVIQATPEWGYVYEDIGFYVYPAE